MKAIKIVLCASIINLVALFLIVQKLPDSVPVHLNINMLVDRYGSRWTIFIVGFIPLVYSVTMLAQRKLIQNKAQSQNKKILNILLPSIAAFLIAVTWLPVLIAYQYGQSISEPLKMPIDFIITFPIGILIIIFSNFMGTIKRNPWMGLRIYWTIADETVWRKTHRLCGFTGVIGGFLICAFAVAGFLLKNPIVTITGFIAGMILFVMIPTVYSYLLYKKLHP